MADSDVRIHPDALPNNQGSDDTSMIELMNVLLRQRRLIIALPLLFSIAAVIATAFRPVKYVALASFMPQIGERNAAGGAAALARQWGVSLGNDRPGYSPEFFADLVVSRDILRAAVESEYTGKGRSSGGRTLLEIYDIPNQAPEAWQKAADRLRKDMAANVSDDTDVVNISVLAPDPMIAEQIAARLLDLVNEFNLRVRRSRAIEEMRFTMARLKEMNDSLSQAENALKVFLERNRNFGNSPELQFERDRLERQVTIRQEMYTTLSQSMEQERLESLREMPVLTIVNRPEGGARRAPRGTIKNGVLALLLGAFVAVTIALLSDYYRRNGAARPHARREFEELTREAFGDLRWPRRFFRLGKP